MDTWRDIRLKARECHYKALDGSNGNRDSDALIKAALELDDLQIHRYQPGTVVGDGVYGFLDRDAMIVNVASGQTPQNERVVIAHEYGHYHMHRDPRSEVTLVSVGLGGDPIDSGAGRVEGYSPRERKEVQADIFAGEFLCPSDWLRQELLERSRRPREIAEQLGLPPNLVMNQTIRALLLPPLVAPAAEVTAQPPQLDESQHEAATWDRGPLLVDAGPGTGKTRTLIHRIHYLLDKGISPASILALTFSNKAAEEMRERLSTSNSNAAIEMWIGTFHAFGLELVTKWHRRIGRSLNLRVLDGADALALLEENLARLPLRYFQNLYEPAYDLVHVLRAISRCKDELISPASYRAEAEAALAIAGTDEEHDLAEKALELATIYEVYQDLLKEADAVDFGDLVMLSAQALESHADLLAEYQNRFEHVLVDEYQDVNLASSRLLHALCKPGSDVWVVADKRQSIYRFRGAEPSNVQRFEMEFSGSTRALGFNYRSGAPVVRVFQAFAANMRSSSGGGWIAKRGNVGEIRHVVTPSIASEALAIRDHIEHIRSRGTSYSDQVILARSHLTLARIAGQLEKLGIPLLYLGDVFEREEVRDLLSLTSIDAEPGGIGLVRVAQFSEYRATREDALITIRWARDKQVMIMEALRHSNDIDGLSPQGRAGLMLLSKHLEGIEPGTTPWLLLTTWLFERSNYLAPLINSTDAKDQQKLIAIYQLLKVCGELAEDGSKSRKRFLARIRRIEALNDDRIYRAVASEAADIDAVRVMTIHGSKGLEFKAVHLPVLATRYMPASRQGARCPPPPTLSHLAIEADDHDAEEECLFFVALSRAQDFLFLSRAERYSAAQKSNPSRFLSAIESHAAAVQYTSSPPVMDTAIALSPPVPRERYAERQLSLYIQCPARYRYEAIEGLRGASDDSPYICFHRCVYRTMGWLESQRSAGKAASLDEALAKLIDEWTHRGPIGHGFEPYYRASAEAMIRSMTEFIASETGTYDRSEWHVDLGCKQVSITPDRVVISRDGIVHVQRIRTGRKTKSEASNRIYALLRHGAANQYPDKPISIETLYLSTQEIVSVIPSAKDENRLKEYTAAISEIEHGDFRPAPGDSRRCPSCQCYLICTFVNGVT